MISINVNNVKLSLCTCRATNTWQPGGGGGLSTQQCLHFECSNRFGHILTYLTFNVQSDKLCFYFKYSLILNLMPATRSKTAGTRACLPLCYISFPSNNTQ